MNLKKIMTAGMLTLGLTSFNANAAFVDVTLLPKASSGTLHLIGAPLGSPNNPNANPLEIEFESAAIADKILFSNAANSDLHDQSPATIAGAIKSEFNLTNNLVMVGQNDNLGGKDSAIFESRDPFKFLAVHFGQHELFFQFLTGITKFEIEIEEGKAAGLSNFRAYDAPSAVPVPAALWLFGSAFAGVLGFNRKKAK